MKNDSKEIFFFLNDLGGTLFWDIMMEKKNVIAPPDSLFQMGKRKKRRKGNFIV